MKNNVFLEYSKEVKAILNSIEYRKYKKAFNKFQKIIIIGNGGSNSIASHIAQDMTKFHNKKALSFSDPSMLTCFINDFGIRMFFTKSI